MIIDNIIVIGFALFLFLGAFFGWRAGSKISLSMGLVSGSLVLLGHWILKTNQSNGFLFLTIIGVGLNIVFYKRFRKTRKFMPSGMLMSVSVFFSVFCFVRLIANL